MPYITQDRRDAIEKGEAPQNPGELNYRLTAQLLSAGDIGEVVVHLLQSNIRGICDQYLDTCQRLTNGPMRYVHINDVMGALFSATHEYKRRMQQAIEKMDPGPLRDEARERCTFGCNLLLRVSKEFYDEVAAPYEDVCIIKNGDIHYA